MRPASLRRCLATHFLSHGVVHLLGTSLNRYASSSYVIDDGLYAIDDLPSCGTVTCWKDAFSWSSVRTSIVCEDGGSHLT